MRDIRHPVLLYAKGTLFVAVGTLAAVLLLLRHSSIEVAVLLAVAIWAFCRAYYFAFYVIEHYIDPQFKFAGLMSVARHLARQRPWGRPSATGEKSP
jgi:hypothetical protein